MTKRKNELTPCPDCGSTDYVLDLNGVPEYCGSCGSTADHFSRDEMIEFAKVYRATQVKEAVADIPVCPSCGSQAWDGTDGYVTHCGSCGANYDGPAVSLADVAAGTANIVEPDFSLTKAVINKAEVKLPASKETLQLPSTDTKEERIARKLKLRKLVEAQAAADAERVRITSENRRKIQIEKEYADEARRKREQFEQREKSRRQYKEAEEEARRRAEADYQKQVQTSGLPSL